MKLRMLITAIALAMMASSVNAQHGHEGDVEFGYDDVSNPTAFDIEHDEFTSEGILFFFLSILFLQHTLGKLHFRRVHLPSMS